MQNFNVSQRYAKGLSSLLRKDEMSGALLSYRSFVNIISLDKKRIFNIVSGPQFSIEEKILVLDLIIKVNNVIPILKKFFRLLLEKNRFKYIFQIFKCFEDLHNLYLDRIKITIFSNRVLKKNFQHLLCNTLEEKLSK
jgi:F0F1-type ATP synthase delta subunit